LVELFANFKVLGWHKGFDFGDAQVGHLDPFKIGILNTEQQFF
jgi:hypothetical protein